MKRFFFAGVLVILQCLAILSSAADTTDIRFEYKTERLNSKEVLLSVTARLAPGKIVCHAAC
ncbi:hypothetical protein KRR40_37475 [Niabella defluvii]|nr:hypothetical protein KRR40_37475 [Niabella sp. I65]